MTDNAIEVEGLVKKYGEDLAVNGVTFDVRAGETFAFLGPNGAGKTTTVEILECIRSLTSGSARVLGHDVTKPSDARSIKRRIGILLQDFSTFENLTVKETLQFFARIYGKKVDGDVLESLELADKANKRFDSLSGGLKQRVGIASALMNDPEVVFLDEPTTGLDPRSRRMTWEFIRKLEAEGKTIFLTTHYMEEAQYLADRIGIINKGSLVALDTPDGLVSKYGGLKKLVIHRGDRALAESLKADFPNIRMTEDGRLIIYINDAREVHRSLDVVSSIRSEQDFEVLNPTVEDVFLNIVGAKISEEGVLI